MKIQLSSRKSRGWAGGAIAMLVVASVITSIGGVSTRAAAEIRSATRVENPSAAGGAFGIATADRDVLDLQLD